MNFLINVTPKNKTQKSTKKSLFDAIRKNNIDECAKLIKKGADVNEISKNCELTPLDLTLMCDYRNIAVLLRNHGAKTNYVVKNLSKFITNNSCEFVEFILSTFKIDLNDKEYFSAESPLHVAINNNARDKVLLLLKYGANPLFTVDNHDYCNKKHEKVNAFEYAIIHGRYDILQLITTYFSKQNTQIFMLLLGAREHDEGSLLHRDYLPLDMFRLIFRFV